MKSWNTLTIIIYMFEGERLFTWTVDSSSSVLDELIIDPIKPTRIR